jgi:hypothetical protein
VNLADFAGVNQFVLLLRMLFTTPCTTSSTSAPGTGGNVAPSPMPTKMAFLVATPFLNMVSSVPSKRSTPAFVYGKSGQLGTIGNVRLKKKRESRIFLPAFVQLMIRAAPAV